MRKLPALILRGLVAITLVTAVACSDPEKRKQEHLAAADAFASQGKYEEAILEYRNAIKADARFGEARFKLADAYLRTQNTQQAVKELLRAAELLPNRSDVQAKAALVLLAAQDFEGARKYAGAAVKADPKSVDAQILLANALAGLKETAGAVRELELAMQLAPTDSRPYTTLGGIRAKEGNRDQADAAFRKALEIDPRSVQARTALAYYYWATQRADQAEETLKGAIAISPSDNMANRMLALFYLTHNRLSDAETPLLRLVNAKDPAGMVTLADLYVRTGRGEQARPLYETLKTQKPTRTIAVARLASLEYAANKREQAYRMVDDELKQQPNNAELLTMKAQCLTQDRLLDDAAATAQNAVDAAPKSGAAKYSLGLTQAAKGENDEAIKSFTEALSLNPRLTVAELPLARLLLARGDTEEALSQAQIAKAADPRLPEARLFVATALLMKRDLTGAESELKTLLVEFPGSAAVHSMSGQLALAKRDGATAVREFDQALVLNPADLQALSGRLAIDLQQKRTQDGRARLQRALKNAPGNAQLLIVAARFENTAGDSAAAEGYLRKAIEADPSYLEGYNLLAQLYVRENRLDEAKKELQEATKRKPDSVPMRTMIGMILDTQRKHDESQKIYESIVNQTSRAPVASNNLAYIYAMRGEKLDLALQLAQGAKAQMPDNPEVNDTLGWVYYQQNLPQLALRPLELSVGKDPRNPVYQFHLGLAYAKAGERRKARAALEAALKLQPDFEGADLARTTLASLKG
jgi:putative PEP-CTERM system TPR-repeat lipoprotein